MSDVARSGRIWPLRIAWLVAVGNGLALAVLPQPQSPRVGVLQFGVSLGVVVVVLIYAHRYRQSRQVGAAVSVRGLSRRLTVVPDPRDELSEAARTNRQTQKP